MQSLFPVMALVQALVLLLLLDVRSALLLLLGFAMTTLLVIIATFDLFGITVSSMNITVIMALPIMAAIFSVPTAYNALRNADLGEQAMRQERATLAPTQFSVLVCFIGGFFMLPTTAPTDQTFIKTWIVIMAALAVHAALLFPLLATTNVFLPPVPQFSAARASQRKAPA